MEREGDQREHSLHQSLLIVSIWESTVLSVTKVIDRLDKLICPLGTHVLMLSLILDFFTQ